MLLFVPNFVLPTANQLRTISNSAPIDSIDIDMSVCARMRMCVIFFSVMWFELYSRKYLAFIFK